MESGFLCQGDYRSIAKDTYENTLDILTVLRGANPMKQAKGLEEKLMTPAEAVGRFIRAGAQIAPGGFTITWNPMALIHEVIRQKIRDLHVVCHSNGQGLDLFIGGGCVGRWIISPVRVGWREGIRGNKSDCSGEVRWP